MFETLGITLVEFQNWLLIFIRIAVLISVLPIFSNESLDPRLKVFLAFFLSLILFKIIPYEKSLPMEFVALIFYAIKEAVVGLCIGMFTAVVFESFRFAGSQVGHLMGINMAETIDPLYSEESQVIVELFNIIAVLLILAINGHHFFIRVIADSFVIVPLNGLQLPAELLPKFIAMLSAIVVAGIRIAAPIMVLLLLIRIMVGILNKMVQEADIFSIILVLNILLGMYLLQFYWTYYATVVNELFSKYRQDILILIKMMG
ncbi:MAG TPA: flagellar biosynthetic protein FliR [Candidatus Cloacimonadota bacterium]|nr:flagellar biosynthetic protein FliR [Candidatus Cloacimonadota bacterium]HQB40930.1 flagellar biosynthetic protein FliR [Candidatus Cloacimonadota bacterium]